MTSIEPTDHEDLYYYNIVEWNASQILSPA